MVGVTIWKAGLYPDEAERTDGGAGAKLEELTLKIEDVETLLEDVSDVAYDKAVEVVTDKVREQTQLEDLEVIEKYRKSVVSPNAKIRRKW